MNINALYDHGSGIHPTHEQQTLLNKKIRNNKLSIKLFHRQRKSRVASILFQISAEAVN